MPNPKITAMTIKTSRTYNLSAVLLKHDFNDFIIYESTGA